MGTYNEIVSASLLIVLVGKFPVHVVDQYPRCFTGVDAITVTS